MTISRRGIAFGWINPLAGAALMLVATLLSILLIAPFISHYVSFGEPMPIARWILDLAGPVRIAPDLKVPLYLGLPAADWLITGLTLAALAFLLILLSERAWRSAAGGSARGNDGLLNLSARSALFPAVLAIVLSGFLAVLSFGYMPLLSYHISLLAYGLACAVLFAIWTTIIAPVALHTGRTLFFALLSGLSVAALSEASVQLIMMSRFADSSLLLVSMALGLFWLGWFACITVLAVLDAEPVFGDLSVSKRLAVARACLLELEDGPRQLRHLWYDADTLAQNIREKQATVASTLAMLEETGLVTGDGAQHWRLTKPLRQQPMAGLLEASGLERDPIAVDLSGLERDVQQLITHWRSRTVSDFVYSSASLSGNDGLSWLKPAKKACCEHAADGQSGQQAEAPQTVAGLPAPAPVKQPDDQPKPAPVIGSAAEPSAPADPIEPPRYVPAESAHPRASAQPVGGDLKQLASEIRSAAPASGDSSSTPSLDDLLARLPKG